MIRIILLLAIAGLTVPIMNVSGGDANCDTDPNDPRCTGEDGAGGMNFCVPGDRFGDCYDADFSRIDCNEHQQHTRCIGHQGRDGLIFCDVQYQDMGFKDNCYDRNDNPKEYCDNYAKEESDRWHKAEFCQAICDNYQEVISKEESCTN
jgi:hypothetical protein